ncbi:4-hydroxy-3-methylbut-2-enyl diphosphate reductase [uncultured Roseovarius sp.]|uniref:4-hydroxy-3-methylbut-2-enyl diphosphate reductase n=1 Tax=uncultured Roseovarius sp. TaxID=293344 RepID=UPI0030DB5B4E
MTKPPLTLYLAAPRGFCAGVDRAIKIVEMALSKWGAPVYVRHEIVHNKYVVDDLRTKGAVFVEELDECPTDRPVIFSAHGVPKSVPAEAAARQMLYVDATCPLVSKVHIEAERHHENGLQIVMIGHAGHPETVGTMGQLPDGEVLLVETPADVATLDVRDANRLAFVTQTTLSVDDTAEVVAALQTRFPAIVGPHKEDICYATTNRHEAGKEIVLIGHAGHPEVIGTMGQLPDGAVTLIETVEDALAFTPKDPANLAFATQTTLSVDDTAGIVAALRARFPLMAAPHKEDICYATTNRQEAVKAMAERAEAMLVVGAPNSSNSKRLVEVGARAGCAYAQLVQRASDIDWRALDGIRSMGITAGASAPEVLVNEVIDAFRARYDVTVEVIETAQENVEFKVPRVLREKV